MVTSHLDTCAECRDELMFLQQIKSAVAEDPSATLLFRSQFSRTMAKIDALEGARPVGVMQRLREFLDAVWNPQGQLVRTALVVQLAAIILLAGVLILRQPEVSFTTLSGWANPRLAPGRD